MDIIPPLILIDVTRKIMWSTFFDHAFDFSMVFDEFKRPLTLFAPKSFDWIQVVASSLGRQGVVTDAS